MNWPEGSLDSARTEVATVTVATAANTVPARSFRRMSPVIDRIPSRVVTHWAAKLTGG